MNIQSHPTYENQLAAAQQFIVDHDDFLVVSHIDPDGDAVSSTLAVRSMLKQLNKRYTLINEGYTPQKFNFLVGCAEIVDFSQGVNLPKFTRLIAVDCADFSRIGKVRNLLDSTVEILNIDHHCTNNSYGTVQLIRTEAASTTEVLYDLANQLDLKWTKELGDCIYTGLLTDSGGFRYANTTPKVMRIAAEMLQYGVNGNELANRLLEKLSLSHVILLQKALGTLSFAHQKQICWVSVSRQAISEAFASNDDLEGLVNYPRNIEGVEVGILFKEVESMKYKVSMRSAGKVNVSAIAQSFGGGGHTLAAGCTLVGLLSDVVEKVIGKVSQSLV